MMRHGAPQADFEEGGRPCRVMPGLHGDKYEAIVMGFLTVHTRQELTRTTSLTLLGDFTKEELLLSLTDKETEAQKVYGCMWRAKWASSRVGTPDYFSAAPGRARFSR